MIVNRWTVTVKRGHMGEAVAWCKALNWPTPYRLNRAYSGTMLKLEFESECESMAEYERLMAEFMARPDMAELNAKLSELTESPTTNEFWTRVE